MALYIGNKKISNDISDNNTINFIIEKEILPNVVFLGDSITDVNVNGEWVKVIKKYATFKSLTNYARGYATWSFKSDSTYNITDTSDSNIGNNVIWNQYNRMVNDINNGKIDNPDCIIIFAGTNDALQNKTLGTPSEIINSMYQTGEITTFTNVSASIRYVVELIFKNYPKCQVILATPLQAKSKQSTAKIREVRDVIIECAKLLGVKVIDQTNESGIYQFREYTNNTYLKDDVHLKPEGGDFVARFLAREFYNKINDRYIERSYNTEVFGNIIVNNISLSVVEEETTNFSVRLDKAPTNEQTVELSISNNDILIDKASLIFDSLNYNIPQVVTITGSSIKASTYSTITLSSNNVRNKLINVAIIKKK